MKSHLDAARNRLSRRSFLRSGVATGLSALAAGTAFGQRPAGQALFDRIVTVDTHGHPGPFYRKNDGEALAYHAIKEIKASPLTAFTYSVVADSRQNDSNPYWWTMHHLKAAAALMRSEGVTIARRADDIADAKRAGRKACLLAIEGGGFANGKLSAVEEAHRAGVRIVQPVHDTPNDFAMPQIVNYSADLKPAGRDFVKELNRLGIVIDVAHMSMQGVVTTAELSTAPIMLSHAMHIARKHPQNHPLNGIHGRTTYERHRTAVVGTGGLIGVWNLDHAVRRSNLHTLFGHENGKEFFIDTFKWLADEYGVDHVALGSDLDATADLSGWFKNYRQLPELADQLGRAGFNDEEIGKMLGGNFLRVFKAAETARTGRTPAAAAQVSLRDMLAGNTLIFRNPRGRRIAAYYESDGRLIYDAPSGVRVNRRWWVRDGNILCRKVGRQDRQRTICLAVAPVALTGTDRVVLSFKRGKMKVMGKILKGNQLPR